MWNKFSESSPSCKNFIFLLILLSFYLFTLIAPFLLYGPHSLGYDTGFYRRYLINPFVSVLNNPVPGLDHTIFVPRIVLDFVRLLGFSPDITLYGSYIVILLLTVVTFYFLVQEYTNKKTALIASTLLVLSPVFYVGYWFMLYKNFIAVIFLFLVFIFLKRRKYILTLLIALLVPLTHQSTTIFLLCFFIVLLVLIFFIQKRVPIKEGGIFIATLILYLYLHPHVQQKIDAPPVGIFLEKLEFLALTAPLLVCFFISIKNLYPILKKNLTLLSFLTVGAIFPIFSLPYYQRIFLFLNFALIIVAAIGVFYILQKESLYTKAKKSFLFVTIFIFFMVQGLLLFHEVRNKKPLISRGIINELGVLQIRVPGNASVITTPNLTPWVQGWTLAKVYAPGILKDKHSFSDWQMYWQGSSESKIDFFSAFPKPLYIFIDEEQKNLFIPNVPCMQKISNMLYRDDCIK